MGGSVFMLVLAIILCLLSTANVFLSDNSDGLPATNTGVLSLMTPTAYIEDIEDYRDELFYFMRDEFPDEIADAESYGHHNLHMLHFGEGVGQYKYYGQVIVSIAWDRELERPDYQKVNCNLWLENSDTTANKAVEYLDKYFGVSPDIALLRSKIESSSEECFEQDDVNYTVAPDAQDSSIVVIKATWSDER